MYQRMTVDEFKRYLRDYRPSFDKLYKYDHDSEKGKWIRYHRVYCGFDIETTTIEDRSYMYIWQFGYMTDNHEQIVVKGRKWHEFEELLRFLSFRFSLRDSTRMIIWIANTSFEFSFIQRRIPNIDEIFCKTSRNPLLIRTGGIEFREALSISQGGLDYLAKTWTNTQKLKDEETGESDLDYSLPRNSKTPLTDKEECYCDNDVIILSEFSERIFNEYIREKKYIPVTSTGILRHELRERAKKYTDNPEKVYHWIRGLFPGSKADYVFIMEKLFRGGFVHACYALCDMILTDMESFDFKSSYPACAFQCYYPVTPFREVVCKGVTRLNQLCKEYCVIFTATFKGLRSKTKHTIESKSKCIALDGALLDNGRVREAKSMTVMLTELDWESYQEFYDWDKVIIHRVECSKRGDLPKYLLDMFYEWFAIKESIDESKDPQGYAITKTRVNGLFGLTVTRLVFNSVTLEDFEWTTEPVGKEYDDMICKQVLSPYWGIYMVAHARRRILSLLYKLKEEVAYSDTDSHKLKYTANAAQVIKEYNDNIKYLNETVCTKYGYDYSIIGKIGMFECETSGGKKGKILRFKTQGAKRYITEYEKKGFESTISGLKKGALDKFCNDKKVDPFKEFVEGMTIPSEYTGKLTPIYEDSRYSDIVTDYLGVSEKMTELSGVYLKPTDFTMTMDKDFLKLILNSLERKIKHAN